LQEINDPADIQGWMVHGSQWYLFVANMWIAEALLWCAIQFIFGTLAARHQLAFLFTHSKGCRSK
jgi:hypothetical protein